MSPIHPLACVETKSIGATTRVWAGTHVMPGAKIGDECNIGEGCYIENDVTIGRGVVIKNHVAIWDRITIEDYAFIGPGVVFTNDREPRAHPDYRTGVARWEGTAVRTGASLGANSTIICGIEIGAWAMIGAGSVVTKNVPAYELWLGNPARFQSYVCMCGKKLNASYACSCGETYRIVDRRLERVDEGSDQ